MIIFDTKHGERVRLITADHDGKTYWFKLVDDYVTAARVKIPGHGRRATHWRNLSHHSPTVVAAANGNGLIVKE
jgi:hypothetical protein